MNLLFESAICNEKMLSEDDKHKIVDAVSNETKDLKSPSQLNAFIASHEAQQKEAESKLSGKKKVVVTKAWDFLKYAAKKGVEFAKRHWKKILLLIAVCAIGWLGYSLFANIIDKLMNIWNIFDKNAASIMAPGEALQKAAAANGQSISDGIAHTITQLANID